MVKSKSKEKGLRDVLARAVDLSKTAKKNKQSLRGGSVYAGRFQECYAEALIELRKLSVPEDAQASLEKLKHRVESIFDTELASADRAKILTEISFLLKSEIEPVVGIPLSKNSGAQFPRLHPRIAKIAQSRFVSEHYADAVEAAFKEVNSRAKAFFKKQTGRELDGVDLMRQAFRREDTNAVILMGDLNSETGRNMQQGYLEIFAGSMAAIRNPKAHGNITIDAERAIHLLFLASLEMYKLDDAAIP